MFKKSCLLIIFLFIISCANETIYSGKIINQDNLNNLNYKNKKNLINKFGLPSYKDDLTNKYFYFSEKKIKKSVFNKKTDYSYIFVFEFDKSDNIVSSNVYDLKNQNDLNFIKEETNSEIIKRGLIEKIFGGVGPQTELPTTP